MNVLFVLLKTSVVYPPAIPVLIIVLALVIFSGKSSNKEVEVEKKRDPTNATAEITESLVETDLPKK